MGLFLLSLQRRWNRWSDQHRESKRYYQNWGIVYGIIAMVGMSYYISVTTLHQFVTSDSNPTNPNVQAGLGLSETWYSWIVGITSIGLFMGSVLLGVLIRWSYAKYTMVANLSLCMVSGILYSAARNSWMLLISRFVLGLYLGSQMAVVRVYLAETSNRMIALLPHEERKTSTIKYTAFFIYFTVAAFFVMLGPGLAAIAAQIPSLDQFRWPGYFLIIHSAVLIVVVLVGMREKWSDLARDDKYCHCSINKIPVPLYTIAFVVGANLIVHYYLSTVEALQNPILSNNFGFSIKYTSYVFIGTLTTAVFAPILIYILQRFKVDNRVISLLAFVICVMGSSIAADWQAIGGDPCDQFTETEICDSNSFCFKIKEVMVMDIVNSSLTQSAAFESPEELCGYCHQCQPTPRLADFSSSLSLDHDDVVCDVFSENPLHCYSHSYNTCLSHVNVNASGSIPPKPIISDTSFLQIKLENFYDLNCSTDPQNTQPRELVAVTVDCGCNASCVCESFSGSPLNCFWNPNSRITGEHCPHCEPLCRSKDHSLNLVQFVIGMMFFTTGYQMARGVLAILVSDLLGEAAQGAVFGILLAAGSVAKLTGPLWGNALYISAGRRTYVDMSILTAAMLVVIVLFLLLYRKMNPHHVTSKEEEVDGNHNGDVITSVVAFVGEKKEGSLAVAGVFFDVDTIFRESEL